MAAWVRIVLFALVAIAVLRLLSFSLWSFFLDLALAMYGLTFLRANFQVRASRVACEARESSLWRLRVAGFVVVFFCAQLVAANVAMKEILTFPNGLAEPDTVVMLESVLLFELLFAVNAAIGVLTLVSLITDTTLLKVPIAEWQQIFGYVVSGCALVPACRRD